MTKKKSNLEARFIKAWTTRYPNIPFEEEICLIPGRRFKFDFVFPGKVAVEINGQIWHKGGHSSGKGLLRDCEKLNLAQIEGYTVIQLASSMINSEWLDQIACLIKQRTGIEPPF